jgi:hypothetical protein
MEGSEAKEKLYLSMRGWEDRVDAARLAEYISSHSQCAKGHHFPKDAEQCPACGSWVPFDVKDFPEGL